jgi:hypothetical protein
VSAHYCFDEISTSECSLTPLEKPLSAIVAFLKKKMKACFFPSQFFLEDAFFYKPPKKYQRGKIFSWIIIFWKTLQNCSQIPRNL